MSLSGHSFRRVLMTLVLPPGGRRADTALATTCRRVLSAGAARFTVRRPVAETSVVADVATPPTATNAAAAATSAAVTYFEVWTVVPDNVDANTVDRRWRLRRVPDDDPSGNPVEDHPAVSGTMPHHRSQPGASAVDEPSISDDVAHQSAGRMVQEVRRRIGVTPLSDWRRWDDVSRSVTVLPPDLSRHRRRFAHFVAEARRVVVASQSSRRGPGLRVGGRHRSPPTSIGRVRTVADSSAGEKTVRRMTNDARLSTWRAGRRRTRIRQRHSERETGDRWEGLQHPGESLGTCSCTYRRGKFYLGSHHRLVFLSSDAVTKYGKQLTLNAQGILRTDCASTPPPQGAHAAAGDVTITSATDWPMARDYSNGEIVKRYNWIATENQIGIIICFRQ